MSELDKGFTAGHMDYGKYIQLADMLKVNITRLQTAIARNQAENCVPKKLQPWEKITTDEKRMVIMSRIDSIKVYQDEVVITKDDLITVFPIIKKKLFASKRPYNALVPSNLKQTRFIEDFWNGHPCRKLVSL